MLRAASWVLRPWVLLLLGAAAAGFLAWLLFPLWHVAGQFSDQPRLQPSRLYEAPPRLQVGDPLDMRDLLAMLRDRGYRQVEKTELVQGEFQERGDALTVCTRSFPTDRGWTVPSTVSLELRDGVLDSARVQGKAARAVELDPELITSYYGPDLLDRWPERLSDLPDHVVGAVLAAEDAGFFRHTGLSLRGTFRALWVNLRGRELRQGGSTLTQQLAKNIYLSPERRLSRKVREAALAVYLELRYSKDEILQTYLNEIFFGRSGAVNLMGIGAAARAYYGVPAAELDVAQSATLAGLIRSPARLSPLTHPDQAQARRDEVLRRMHELGWLDDAGLAWALKQPVGGRVVAVDLHEARYAADAAAAEVAERYGVSSLADAGHVVISTLDRADQEAAEEAVHWGTQELEEGWQKGVKAPAPLQAALVTADPRSGAVRAWVGGRDYGESQFDRVRLARRQVGSAFKPVVLAAAFAERVASPVDPLMDEPVTVVQGRNEWQPHNDDDRFHGQVTVREAVERSINVPMVRLALDVGLDKVIEWARRLGVESRLAKVPSIALGAFEMTPLELLHVYGTFASGGRRVPLHLVEAVLDRRGKVLEGAALPEPEQVLEPGVAYLVTSVLEGVVDHGTGRRLRQDGLSDVLAGKTGTTSGRRDSWFIGYAPQRVTLVWVGYDSGLKTRLSGSRAALPIWGRFMLARRPRGGYSVSLPPDDVVTVTVDPASGQLATGDCPEVVTEVFLIDQAPDEECTLHGRRERWRRFWRFGGGRRPGFGGHSRGSSRGRDTRRPDVPRDE